MHTVIVTLMKRSGDEIKTVSVPNRAGKSVILICKKVLQDNPGYFVRKTTVK